MLDAACKTFHLIGMISRKQEIAETNYYQCKPIRAWTVAHIVKHVTLLEPGGQNGIDIRIVVARLDRHNLGWVDQRRIITALQRIDFVLDE
jgi:hypothetical protein